MLRQHTPWLALAGLLVACGSNDTQRNTCTGTDCGEQKPPDKTPTESELGVERVNKWRVQAGLGALAHDDKIQKAAQAHAKFVASTPQECWPGAHSEVDSPSCPGFTGVTPGDRLTAAGYNWSTYLEAVSFGDETPNDAVDGWLWTVYHRMVLMWPATTDAGFDCEDSYCVLKVARPRSIPAPTVSQPIVFPTPNMTDVPKAWDGSIEMPSPPAPSKGWPSGPVISLYFPGSHAISSAKLTRTDAPGTSLPVVLVTAENDQNLKNISQNDAFVYAESPLAGNTSYTVTVKGTWNNEEWSKSWSFTTKP